MLAYDVVDGFFDDDGVPQVEMRLRMTQAEADALIAGYDPQNATSPAVALARPIARAVGDALAALEPA